jgi:hypothetical protein
MLDGHALRLASLSLLTACATGDGCGNYLRPSGGAAHSTPELCPDFTATIRAPAGAVEDTIDVDISCEDPPLDLQANPAGPMYLFEPAELVLRQNATFFLERIEGGSGLNVLWNSSDQQDQWITLPTTVTKTQFDSGVPVGMFEFNQFGYFILVWQD